jgi:hypothetical protein
MVMADAPDKKSGGGGLSLQTLLISATAAVAAATVVPLFWQRGTVIATAMTPVIVALVSEGLRKPVHHVSTVAPRVSWAQSPAKRRQRLARRPRQGRVAPSTCSTNAAPGWAWASAGRSAFMVARVSASAAQGEQFPRCPWSSSSLTASSAPSTWSHRSSSARAQALPLVRSSTWRVKASRSLSSMALIRQWGPG